MEFRHLGRSGLVISEIAYGNWITHGSQVEAEAAHACVRAALDAGITTFDTADVYAATRAEVVLGDALKGERREGLEIFTKVYWPTGPAATTGDCPASTSWSRSTARCAGCGPTTSTSTRRTGTTTRRRWKRRCWPSPTSCGQGKALYIGVSEWTAPSRSATRCRAGRGTARPADLQPAAVQHALAGDRGRGRAGLRASSGWARSSGRRSRRACSPASTSRASRSPAGSRATDEHGGAIHQARCSTTTC